MTAFDFDTAVRWARFDPNTPLSRRADADLPFVGAGGMGGQALLLDTCVYIDQLQGRAPASLEALIETRLVHHSTIAV